MSSSSVIRCALCGWLFLKKQAAMYVAFMGRCVPPSPLLLGLQLLALSSQPSAGRLAHSPQLIAHSLFHILTGAGGDEMARAGAANAGRPGFVG